MLHLINSRLRLSTKVIKHNQNARANSTMKRIIYIMTLVALVSCNSNKSQKSSNRMIEQTELSNSKIKEYAFLDCMYQDSYFPNFLVDKCKNILLDLCYEIERNKPTTLDDLYKLTNSSTDKLNDLQAEFFENDSEIETAARECLAVNFEFVADAYGFEADIEELIATRDW